MAPLRLSSHTTILLLIAGLFAVNFLVVMMTALTSVATIAGEIDSHTIQSLATKPIHRMEIVLGKWLGYATMLTLYVLFMAGGLISIVYFSSGYTPPNVMLGISLLILEGLVVLSLSIFGGTFFPTLGNGVMVFMLYGIAFIGGWVEQIGAAMESETAVQIGIIASLLMPSEALWRMVSDYMMPPIVDMLTAGPFTAFSKPSSAMIIYAVIYVVVLLSGALIQFNRRDL